MRNSLLELGPIKLGVKLFQNFADYSKLLIHNDINNIFYLIDWSELKKTMLIKFLCWKIIIPNSKKHCS